LDEGGIYWEMSINEGLSLLHGHLPMCPKLSVKVLGKDFYWAADGVWSCEPVRQLSVRW
jgi:hypothetical protein